MAIAAGYQTQGQDGDVDVNIIGIKGGISRPNQLAGYAEYMVLHIWTAEIENCMTFWYSPQKESYVVKYKVEDTHTDDTDTIDGSAEYDVEAEMLPVKPEPPTAYYAIRFYWRNRSTGESKERAYDFSENRNAKAVDFALEFDDNYGEPQETDWKCFFNGQVKRHGSDSWEDINRDWFTWKEWEHPEIANVHSEDWSNHKFWQRKELK